MSHLQGVTHSQTVTHSHANECGIAHLSVYRLTDQSCGAQLRAVPEGGFQARSPEEPVEHRCVPGSGQVCRDSPLS